MRVDAGHLPHYRIEGILARQGVDISRSTLGDWNHKTANNLLKHVVGAIEKDVLESPIVRTDDTSIRVLDRSAQPEGAYNGRVWAFLGAEPGDVLFAFSETRKNADPESCHAVLKDFEDGKMTRRQLIQSLAMAAAAAMPGVALAQNAAPQNKPAIPPAFEK